MSRKGFVSRYLLEIQLIKNKPFISYEEIKSEIQIRQEWLDFNESGIVMDFSKRTLQRDLKDIREIFGVHIEYSRSNKGYFFNESESHLELDRLIDSFYLFGLSQVDNSYSQFIIRNDNVPAGANHIPALLKAIKSKKTVNIQYQPFWVQKASSKVILPLLLKEYKSRWYLIAGSNSKIKTYALDRMLEVRVLNDNFQYDDYEQLKERLSHCYGIIYEEGADPEKVQLLFNPYQGNYIKSLPLHSSQIVMKDDSDGLLVEIKVYITFDLIMDLRSFIGEMKVVCPKSLKEKIFTKSMRDEYLENW